MKHSNKEYNRICYKLKWVEKEFVVPAFEEYMRHVKSPVTMSEYEEFISNLFTHDSKVQVIQYGCMKDLCEGVSLYAMTLGYITDDSTLITGRTFCISNKIEK